MSTEPLAPTPQGSEPSQPGDPASISVMAGCRSVAYVLVAALALMGGVVAWRVSQWGPAPTTSGSGSALDLTTCLVPRETILRGTLPGSIPHLTVVRSLSASEADTTKIRRGKFLVKGDLVIGVAIGEEAMAYPLRFLVWHEVVEDTLGGTPIVVCYGPWDGGVGVFDRRPMSSDGTPGEIAGFVPAGVVSNSAQLFASRVFERSAPESLWSSLQARAVTGPAAKAGLRLRRLSAEVIRWEDWRELHPKTRVLAHDEERLKLYGRAPYKTYLGSDTLRFPVEPLPPVGLPRKAAILAVRRGSVWRVYPVDALVAAASAGQSEVRHGESKLRFQAWRNDEKPAAARFLDPVDEVVRAYWFAWYAAREDARTLGEDFAN